MAQQPSGDGKIDFSNLPRGAIGIKGFPVNRNTRLPSIRSPRDLTLGAQSKRNFVPNIPVRREKRQAIPDKVTAPIKVENVSKNIKNASSRNERGRGRGRGRAQLIQLQGSVFGEGIAASAPSPKDRHRESFPRASSSTFVNNKPITIKKEKVEGNATEDNDILNNLLRDDFVDDGLDDEDEMTPIIFPLPYSMKKESDVKSQPKITEVGMKNNYDEIAKMIKKEDCTPEEKKISMKKIEIENMEKSFSELMTDDDQHLLLLQFPNCITLPRKSEDLDRDFSKKDLCVGNDNSSSNDQQTKSRGTELSSLSEGYIGKLETLKSGKIRLVLGNLVFNMEKAEPVHTKTEVVSVRTNHNGGDAIVLGNLKQKLAFIPKVENVL